MDVVSTRSSAINTAADEEEAPGRTFVGVGALTMSAVQAVCVFFVALAKMGILVGLASLFSTVIASRFHAPGVRTPVLTLALIGAVANLFMLRNWHRLRNAPAAAWRKRPLTPQQQWRLASLLAMSVVTIVLAAGEFLIHAIEGT